MQTYAPSYQILKNYADVLVKFALHSGEGVRPGEVVFCSIPECARVMVIPLQTAIIESRAHMILQYTTDEYVARTLFELGNEEQIKFVPKEYLLARANTIDHTINIIADAHPQELEGVDPKKIMSRSSSFKFYKEALDKKENEGLYTWTLGLFGTSAMAQEAGCTIEEYWQQIIQACFLDEADPVSKNKEVFAQISDTKEKLNALSIEWLHVQSETIDLKIKIGANRKWLGGSGRNIPSFELFISPDWRGTEGTVTFTEPLFQYGSIIEGITLTFAEGRIVSSQATRNEAVLKEMIATKNADKIGEFSLTDRRFSRITRFMANTLFDENRGGEFGNTHIAIGSAYKESFRGDVATTTQEQWEELGFNDSVVHTDIVSTENRTVTATLIDGTQVVIYKDGQFTV